MSTKANILLIYTGGTIGMTKDPETGALRAFDFDNILIRIPELNLLDCNIETVSFKNPIDSSDMNPTYWIEIAEILEKNYNTFDGFVVLHGSDTMSYTASALSFMLENLDKPVILTGSQLPIGDLRTDAKENLITSIQIAALKRYNKPVVQEVGLYFEYKLYRGNRTTKINAEHFEAFASPNFPHLIESGVHLNIHKEYLFKPKNKDLIIRKNINTDIAVIKLFPAITPLALKTMLSIPNLKGVVLETYGAGNCSTNQDFLDVLKEAITKGIAIVNVTQCAGGSVIMGQYETSSKLKRIGIISGHDITTEAAVAKLMYLLGQNLDPKSLKTIFETSLRGELSQN